MEKNVNIESEKNVEKLNEYFDSICITDEEGNKRQDRKEIPTISLNDDLIHVAGGNHNIEMVISTKLFLARAFGVAVGRRSGG